jgi:AraC-like DNA-binding protein
VQVFEHAAGPGLSAFVDRFWAIRAAPSEEVSLADPLPGTGAELLIHCGAPLRLADGKELPAAHLLCLRRGPLGLAPALRGVDLFAIRFRAGAVRHFVEPEPSELADVLVPFPDLAGPLARSLCDQVATARGFEQRVGSAELALGELLHRFRRPNGLVDRAVAQLYASGGSVRIEALAGALGLGRRQLARRLGQALGISPKRFARLVRFQKTIRGLLLDERREALPVALDHGFYDQAHFAHEVRELTGRSPTALLRDMAGKSHFYKRSLHR